MGVITMFTFSIVKKIGEGNYLGKDNFIIERVRKERALNMRHIRFHSNKHKIKPFSKNDRFSSS